MHKGLESQQLPEFPPLPLFLCWAQALPPSPTEGALPVLLNSSGQSRRGCRCLPFIFIFLALSKVTESCQNVGIHLRGQISGVFLRPMAPTSCACKSILAFPEGKGDASGSCVQAGRRTRAAEREEGQGEKNQILVQNMPERCCTNSGAQDFCTLGVSSIAAPKESACSPPACCTSWQFHSSCAAPDLPEELMWF